MGAEFRPSVRDRFRAAVRRRLLDRLRQLTAPQNARLLDLGGGTGAATVMFGAGARELVVLEPDPRRIAQGRAAHTPVTFVEGAAETIPFGPERFERVVSLMSFHHFSSGDAVLREAARVLAPGGRLVVFDFDPATPSGRWISFFEGRVMGHGFHFVPPAELGQRALAAGFRTVRREPYGAGAFLVAER